MPDPKLFTNSRAHVWQLGATPIHRVNDRWRLSVGTNELRIEQECVVVAFDAWNAVVAQRAQHLDGRWAERCGITQTNHSITTHLRDVT